MVSVRFLNDTVTVNLTKNYLAIHALIMYLLVMWVIQEPSGQCIAFYRKFLSSGKDNSIRSKCVFRSSITCLFVRHFKIKERATAGGNFILVDEIYTC